MAYRSLVLLAVVILGAAALACDLSPTCFEESTEATELLQHVLRDDNRNQLPVQVHPHISSGPLLESLAKVIDSKASKAQVRSLKEELQASNAQLQKLTDLATGERQVIENGGNCMKGDFQTLKAMGPGAHTIRATVEMPIDFPTANQRQWILNLGQSGGGANRWNWSPTDVHKHGHLELGGWNGGGMVTGVSEGVTNCQMMKASSLTTTWDGNETYSFYINGKLKKTIAITIPFDITSNNLRVGLKPDGWGDLEGGFSGCITQVEVWDSALTSNEVAASETKVQRSKKVLKVTGERQVIENGSTCMKGDFQTLKAMGCGAHTIRATVKMPIDLPTANQRQWILNLGQSGSGGNRWNWSPTDVHKHGYLELGTWNGGGQVAGVSEGVTNDQMMNASSLTTTWDGNETYSFYIDGQLKKTIAITIPFDITSNNLRVGLKPDGWGDLEGGFSGCVIKVEVWDSALTSNKVAAAFETSRWQL